MGTGFTFWPTAQSPGGAFWVLLSVEKREAGPLEPTEVFTDGMCAETLFRSC